jgi:hypothetical protein
LVFVKQRDYCGDEKVVTLYFDFSCEKTRQHIRQFTLQLLRDLEEYENSISSQKEGQDTSQ